MRGPRRGAYATRASRQHDLEVRMTRVGTNDVGLVDGMVTGTYQEVIFHYQSSAAYCVKLYPCKRRSATQKVYPTLPYPTEYAALPTLLRKEWGQYGSNPALAFVCDVRDLA